MIELLLRMEALNITWWSDGYNCIFYLPTPFLPSGLSGWRGQRGDRSVTREWRSQGRETRESDWSEPGNSGLSLADTIDHLMSHLLGSKVHYGLTASPGGNILAFRGSVLFSWKAPFRVTWDIRLLYQNITVLRCDHQTMSWPLSSAHVPVSIRRSTHRT